MIRLFLAIAIVAGAIALCNQPANSQSLLTLKQIETTSCNSFDYDKSFVGSGRGIWFIEANDSTKRLSANIFKGK